MRMKMVTRVAMVALSLLILLGVMASFWMLSIMEKLNNIEVNLVKGKQEIIKFTDPELDDGEEEYTISLKANKAGEYTVLFSFGESKGNTLRDDIYAKVSVAGKTVCNTSLAKLFDGDALEFVCELGENEHTDVTVLYYIPEDSSIKSVDSKIDFYVNIMTNN
ncbi:MAG: hypothetical protein IJW79_01110 [Clostridia bacterium]|nr:hypothetical protein [Clostridia bacterium]